MLTQPDQVDGVPVAGTNCYDGTLQLGNAGRPVTVCPRDPLGSVTQVFGEFQCSSGPCVVLSVGAIACSPDPQGTIVKVSPNMVDCRSAEGTALVCEPPLESACTLLMRESAPADE